MPYKDIQKRREAAREYTKKYRSKLPLEIRKQRYKDENYKKRLKTRGLTPESYEALFLSQNKQCAICFKPLLPWTPNNQRTKKQIKDFACVDHCHQTGNTRGILCWRCNLVLGHVNDNVQLLDKMMQYVLKYQ